MSDDILDAVRSAFMGIAPGDNTRRADARSRVLAAIEDLEGGAAPEAALPLNRRHSVRSILVMALVLAMMFATGGLVMINRPHSPLRSADRSQATRSGSSGEPATTSATSATTSSTITQPEYHGSSPEAAIVDQYAVNLVASAKGTNVTSVTWVSTTIGAAKQVMPGGPESGLTTAVWVLEMTGMFEPNVPTFNGENLNCTGMMFVVNQTTLTTMRFRCTLASKLPDLNVLGSPETDSLVGLTPNFAKIRSRASERAAG